MKKVIVTGGAGFIGSHVVDALVGKGYDVHVVDNLFAGKKELVPDGVMLHEVDIRDYESLKKACEGAEYIFHLAALPSVEGSIQDPDEAYSVNVTGTHNVLMVARDIGAKKVILSSSSSVYGDSDIFPTTEEAPYQPKSPYAMHKAMNELQMQTWSRVYGVPTVCLRYFNVYGPRMNPEGAYALVIGRFLKLRSEGKPLTITGDGTQTRDFVHVHDVASANVCAAESDVCNGEAMNIGSGSQMSINDLARAISDNIEYIEARLEPHDTCADVSIARARINWTPSITIQEGVKDLLDA